MDVSLPEVVSSQKNEVLPPSSLSTSDSNALGRKNYSIDHDNFIPNSFERSRGVSFSSSLSIRSSNSTVVLPTVLGTQSHSDYGNSSGGYSRTKYLGVTGTYKDASFHHEVVPSSRGPQEVSDTANVDHLTLHRERLARLKQLQLQKMAILFDISQLTASRTPPPSHSSSPDTANLQQSISSSGAPITEGMRQNSMERLTTELNDLNKLQDEIIAVLPFEEKKMVEQHLQQHSIVQSMAGWDRKERERNESELCQGIGENVENNIEEDSTGLPTVGREANICKNLLNPNNFSSDVFTKTGRMKKKHKVDLKDADLENMTMQEIINHTKGGELSTAEKKRIKAREENRRLRKEAKGRRIREERRVVTPCEVNDVISVDGGSSLLLDELLHHENKEESVYNDTLEEIENQDHVLALPQVHVVDGQIVVNPESMVVESRVSASNTALAAARLTTVHEVHGSTSNSVGYGRKAPPDKWKKDDTDMFFKVLQMCGSDFELISKFFPTRTRKQIRAKYKREEKRNPERIDFCFTHPVDLDSNTVKELTGIDLDAVIVSDSINHPEEYGSTPVLDEQQSGNAKKRSRKHSHSSRKKRKGVSTPMVGFGGLIPTNRAGRLGSSTTSTINVERNISNSTISPNITDAGDVAFIDSLL